ncbi:MAG: DNA polymerase III subunit delta' [bacterium]
MVASETNGASPAIIGQETVLQFLGSSLERDRLASAYIFYGPSAVGKRTTARIFLAAILCPNRMGLAPCGTCASCRLWKRSLHPDATILGETAAAIGIDDVRQLQRKLNFCPTVSEYRVALISNAEQLSIEAANALLKTLEEPPHKTLCVLCTTMLSSLPLTLRSRCQQLRFRHVPQPFIYDLLRTKTENVDMAQNLSHVSLGRPGLALSFLSQPEEFAQYRQRITDLIDVLQSPIATRLQRVHQLLPPTRSHEEARQQLLPILDLWIWVIRDALLIRERNQEFIVHRFLEKEIEELGKRYTTHELLSAIKFIEGMKRLARMNVNPQFLLEHCFLSL